MEKKIKFWQVLAWLEVNWLTDLMDWTQILSVKKTMRVLSVLPGIWVFLDDRNVSTGWPLSWEWSRVHFHGAGRTGPPAGSTTVLSANDSGVCPVCPNMVIGAPGESGRWWVGLLLGGPCLPAGWEIGYSATADSFQRSALCLVHCLVGRILTLCGV